MRLRWPVRERRRGLEKYYGIDLAAYRGPIAMMSLKRVVKKE